MMKIFQLFLVAGMIWSCRPPQGDILFYPPKNQGKVSKQLIEASGLVASINNPGCYWTVNDSGNDPEVFLINDQAKLLLTCKLESAMNRDWEDIAIGAGPIDGKNYIYVGDIGDNRAKHDLEYIYRFEEPVSKSSSSKETISNVEKLTLQLPDGPRDAETMIIDPITHDLFIVSKREDSVNLYVARFPFGNDTIKLKKLSKLPYKLIVAGSISANGQEVLLKSYSKIYYWRRLKNEMISELLLRKPQRLSYEPEPQGEAIAWARDSTGFYTLSESSVVNRAHLKYFRRKK